MELEIKCCDCENNQFRLIFKSQKPECQSLFIFVTPAIDAQIFFHLLHFLASTLFAENKKSWTTVLQLDRSSAPWGSTGC